MNEVLLYPCTISVWNLSLSLGTWVDNNYARCTSLDLWGLGACRDCKNTHPSLSPTAHAICLIPVLDNQLEISIYTVFGWSLEGNKVVDYFLIC